MRLLALTVLLVGSVWADEQTQKMTARLGEEAQAFAKLAPMVLGRETLKQRALKPPRRFHPRIGKAALEPPKPVWQTREIVSEYGFSSFAGRPDELHELRQPVSVDGKPTRNAAKALENLAASITSKDDDRKRKLLKEFEKLGLIGAVSDLGQILLLFTPRQIERYEFTFKCPAKLVNEPVLVFSYKQLDGPEALTVFEENKGGRAVEVKLSGEIWVRQLDYLPVRITILSTAGEGRDAVEEQAAVDYVMSPYGALLPFSATHKEMRAAKPVVENDFSYTNFRKFGASAEIKFDTTPPK